MSRWARGRSGARERAGAAERAEVSILGSRLLASGAIDQVVRPNVEVPEVETTPRPPVPDGRTILAVPVLREGYRPSAVETTPDPHLVGWSGMGIRERWTALLAAALAGWEFDPRCAWYQTRLDVVHVLRWSKTRPDRVDAVARRAQEGDADRYRAAYGFKAVEAARQVARELT